MRIVTSLALGALVVAISLTPGCMTSNLPETPDNPSPSDGVVVGSTLLTLSWECGSPTDSVTYALYLGPTPQPPLLVSGLRTPNCAVFGLAPATVYYWQVEARSRRGATATSPTWSFTTAQAPSHNNPPDIPEFPQGPSDGYTGVSYAFSSSAYDPDDDQVALIFDWGDGTRDTSDLGRDERTVVAAHAWETPGIYVIAAQAVDCWGATSEWSAQHSIVVAQGEPVGDEGTLKWKRFMNDAVTSSPALDGDGTIYVGSNDFTVNAVNPDGTPRWSYRTGHWVGSSPALGHDGTIYIGSCDGHVYALTSDGNLKWRFLTDASMGDNQVRYSAALGTDGTVYIGSLDHSLYALSADGALKWSFQTGDWIESCPVLGTDGTIYIGSNDGNLYALTSSGTVKWHFHTGGAVQGSVAIAGDGTIYAASFDGNLYALNPDGSLKWSFPTSGGIYAAPALATDGTIYVASMGGSFHAVSPNGQELWHHNFAGRLVSSPAIRADGVVYLGTGTGLFCAFNPDGQVRWMSQFSSDEFYSSPVIAPDGTVYVGNHDGYLYAINGNSPLASTHWPMYRHDPRHSGRVGGP